MHCFPLNFMDHTFISAKTNIRDFAHLVEMKGACEPAQSPNCVQLLATAWTVAHQAPLSVEFSRQEYLTGLSPFSRSSSWPGDWTCVSRFGSGFTWESEKLVNLQRPCVSIPETSSWCSWWYHGFRGGWTAEPVGSRPRESPWSQGRSRVRAGPTGLGISSSTGHLSWDALPSATAVGTNTLTIYSLGALARFFSIHGDTSISCFQGWIILQGKEMHNSVCRHTRVDNNIIVSHCQTKQSLWLFSCPAICSKWYFRFHFKIWGCIVFRII